MSQEAMTDASGKKLEKKEANLPSELTAMFEACRDGHGECWIRRC